MCVFGTPSECLPPGYAQRTAVAPPNAAHGRGVARRCAAWPGVVVEAAVSGPRARLPGRLVVAHGHTGGPQPSGARCAGPVSPPRHDLRSPTRSLLATPAPPCCWEGEWGGGIALMTWSDGPDGPAPLGMAWAVCAAPARASGPPSPPSSRRMSRVGGVGEGGVRGGSGCARGAQRYQMTSGGGDRPRAGELWSWASGWTQQGAVRGGGPPSKSAASG